MTETQTVDLAAWLTRIWDEEERLARDEVELTEHVYDREFTVEYQWARMTRHASGGWGHSFAPGAPSPTSVLARIAADRAILAWCSERARIYVGAVGDDPSDPKNYMLGGYRHSTDSVVLRLLASAYSDRPGYQEAWRV